MTTMQFASWAQTAVGNALGTGEGPDPLPAARLTPGLSLVHPDGHTTPVIAPSTVTMLGPEAVAGLDPRVVVRTDPPAGAGDVEDNYLVSVDLQPVELPWMFTPAHPDAQHRLRPWIVLVVVEVSKSRLTSGVLGQTLSAGVDELPDLRDSWGWAHVQLSAEPSQRVARLLCPRRLAPTTRYLACIVPSFIYDPVSRSYSQAWTIEQGDEAHLPVYYFWEFGTGVTGDFEDLVRRLGPAPSDRTAKLGRLIVDIQAPWANDKPLHEAPTPAPLAVPGALGIIAATHPDPSLPPTALQDFVSRLAAQCNAGRGLHEDQAPGDTTPYAVAPPIYGGLHVNRDSIPEDAAMAIDWADELNIQIPTRVAAGLGTEYVRAGQEWLMARAWEQAGAIREANRRRAMGQLAAAVGESLHRKHVQHLNPGETMSLAAPAATRTRPWTKELPFATAVAVSVMPTAAASSAFARFVRPGGPVARTAGVLSSSVIERSLAGEIAVPAAKSAPQFATDAERTQVEPRDSALSTASTAERSVTAATDLINLRALADTARVAGLTNTADTLISQLDDLPVNGEDVKTGKLDRLRHSVAAELNSVIDGIATMRAELIDPASGHTGAAATALGVRLDPDLVATALTAALAPAHAIERRLDAEVTVPEIFTIGSSMSPVMKYPEFPAPMALALLSFAPQWFLPGIEEFPAESAALLEANSAFIESFLVGLSQEFNRELLWREFPTDMRGTPFRSFWPRPDGGADIPPIHTWTGGLGSHLRVDTDSLAILLVRGTVIRRFPNMLVAAAPVLTATPGQLPDPDRNPAHWKPPTFVIPLDEQTIAYAFAIAPDALRSPPTPAKPGFFFAFQEHSSRPRFGFDLSNPVFMVWQDLDWKRVLAVDPIQPSRGFAVAGTSLVPSNPGDTQWNRDSADIARIALQRPFRMLIHSSELVRQ
jgi:hypothetical protein